MHSKGVIQQLRGLNFTQLYSLPSLEWTIVDILHDTYPMNQCWTEGRSSTAVAEDLGPTATVAEV